MSARLRKEDFGARGVQRAVIEDVSRAADDLVSDDLPTDRHLHDARKRLKRARAGLRLLRSSLGNATYRRENTRLRDIARALTDIRDAKVLVDAVDKLAKHAGAAERPALLRERAILIEHCREVHDRLERQRIRRLQRSLAAASRRIGGWKLRERDRPGLTDGLRRIYRSGRRSFREAEIGPSMENLHELRKQAKYLWQALEFFEAISPQTINPLVRRSCQLSCVLGDDHDLAVLVKRLRARAGSRPARPTQTVLRLAGQRRARLQEQAMENGRRIYERNTSAFCADLAALWK